MMPSPRETMARVRNVANWANGSTVLGLSVAKLGRAAVTRGPRGLWFAEGYRLGFPIAGAFTVGSVIISASRLDDLEDGCPGVLEHEETHADQWAFCIGLPFLPLYLLTMGWSWLRTGDRAAANWFERHAGLERGGYCEFERRPIRAGFADLRGRVRRR